MIEHPLVEDFSIVPFFFDLSTKKQTFAFIFVHSAQLDRVCAPENSKRERAPIQKRVPLFYCIVKTA